MKDALGNEIKIGSWYGYSRVNNGVSKIVIGKANQLIDTEVKLTHITKQWVKLTHIIKQWGVNEDPNNIVGFGKYVYVFSKTVFPVDINQLKLEGKDN